MPSISPIDLKDKVFFQSFDIKHLLLKWCQEGAHYGQNNVFFLNNEEIDLRTNKQKQAEKLLLNFSAKNSGWIAQYEISNDFYGNKEGLIGFNKIYKCAESVYNLIAKHIDAKKGKQFLVIKLPPYRDKGLNNLQYSWISYLSTRITLVQFEKEIYYVYDNNINKLTNVKDPTVYYYYDYYENLVFQQLPEQFKQLLCDFLTEETTNWCMRIQKEIDENSLFGCHEPIYKYVFYPIYNALTKELCNNNGGIVIDKQYIGMILKSALKNVKKYRIRKQLKKLISAWTSPSESNR